MAASAKQVDNLVSLKTDMQKKEDIILTLMY